MHKNNRNRMLKIKQLTATAMFCAIAFVFAAYVKIPNIQGFLTLDFKDSLIILCSLLFGPVSGVSVAIVVPFLEFITYSTTGVYGLIMNILSTLTVSLTAGLIYRYKKTMTGAIIALLSSVFAVTAVMVLANLLITPLYMGVTMQDVAALIPKLLLPFNLTKATLNAAIVLLLYKPISGMLKKIGFIQSNKKPTEELTRTDKMAAILRTVLVSSIAAVIIVASLLIILLVLA